jgi:hypothetical protein
MIRPRDENRSRLRVIQGILSKGFSAMIRSPGAGHGFGDRAALAASRLSNTIAASLAIGSLSLCLIVTVTVLSIRMVAAMPLPM